MVLENTRLVKIFIFSSYYNVNGISMARRYWKIPSSSFEVEAIPPPPSASPPEVGSIASTSQDSEGIFQYLLALLMPLLQLMIITSISFFDDWQLMIKIVVAHFKVFCNLVSFERKTEKFTWLWFFCHEQLIHIFCIYLFIYILTYLRVRD